MGSMAATLAHELNQPFAAIANYATGVDNLLRPMSIPDLAADGLKQIAANALRAGEIIRRMRSMVDRRRGKTETFDLTNLLKEAAASAGRGVAKTALNLQFKHSGTVVADPVQVMQVAVNIIRNACEAMEGFRRQEISVRTHDDGDFIVVTIADSGPGLPLELNLFEPIGSAKPNGMGIGLSICRTIVEANGGKIWSASTTAGASFFFSLPRIDACR